MNCTNAANREYSPDCGAIWNILIEESQNRGTGMQKSSRIVAAFTLSVQLLLPLGNGAQAAELRVLAGSALAEPLKKLAPQFETLSGHQLVFSYGATPDLIKLATSGAPFDLGVCPEDVLKNASAAAQFAGPATRIAHAGLAVAVRAGASKPDIGTPAALKQTLLDAQSIVTIPASATGTQLLQVFDVLGISEAMRPKLRAQTTPAQIAEAVTRGEGELAVFLINVLMASGLDVVGPFPPELQRNVVFTAAVAANTQKAEIARAFITHLTSPAAIAVLKASGMEPD